jgi:RNA polymerase sigma-70 factor
VSLPNEAFFAYLGARLPPGAGEEALAALHTSDLYLACGCSLAIPQALAEFERHCLAGLERVLARVTPEPTMVEEVRQLLRVKLLVGTDGQPKIIDYTGRGSLQSWVRVAAVRTALNLATRQPQQVELGHAHEPLLGARDLEVDYLKSRYRSDFEEAFRAALRSLAVDHRNLLRLHYLDGLNLAQLGRMHKVHESTMSRRILAAREQLLAQTRAELQRRLPAAPSEIDSLMGQVLSCVDVSLGALFRNTRS